jgi:hypothetical protein
LINPIKLIVAFYNIGLVLSLSEYNNPAFIMDGQTINNRPRIQAGQHKAHQSIDTNGRGMQKS